MKYYTTTTEFNCGIDLHAHQMYVCLMDPQGKKLVHTNVRNNDFDYFLELVGPYRHDLTVCCECMFGWYWLADACQASGLTFVLAHALYVRAIHGGKNKNDRIDSEKIAHLLRSNLIPPAYVHPSEQRPLRALRLQRLFFVWQRSDLLARIQSVQLTYNRPPIRQTRSNRDPWEERLLAYEDNPSLADGTERSSLLDRLRAFRYPQVDGRRQTFARGAGRSLSGDLPGPRGLAAAVLVELVNK